MIPFNKSFAKNLIKARRAADLTQKELAEILGYSEKTISKWECGNSFPSLDTFVKICEVLRVDSRQLLNNNDKNYILGIDGGGTKTAFVLTDTDMKVISSITLGQSNPNDIGMSNSQQLLRDGILKACGEIPLSSVYCFAGIAGCASGNNKSEFIKFFDSLGFAAYSCGSDNDNIIAAGLDTDDGLSIIMGTGFCIYKILGGVRRQIAGFGYFLDEGGSAFNLGREALSAIFSELDGTGEKTLMTEILKKQGKLDTKAIISEIYSGGKRSVASYAPIVFEAEASGDATGSAIIKRNMRYVAEKIEKSSESFPADKKIRVVITGGLTNEQSIVKRLYAELTCPERFLIEILDKRPVEGSLKLAKQLYEEATKNA